METHAEGTTYGDIYGLECLETHIYVSVYGDPYRICKEWRLM